ncbi:DUF945 family protein [Commensalibacter oyaizuii]|uniref:DUF945 domain-containing protein n=1 Tax=Commensalibacter oyaizuii TaxID=3043873 RepID=A0ABT6Q5U0_9PROT|nr:hypothetical protein [Commensalibacter sp. TBRC 16381]MDI2091829.1 hypothetical protein [Commensalibacter sp. TBRC 16381]
MSKAAIAGGIIIVIAAAGGGGYYYASQQAEQALQNRIKQIEKLAPGASLTYAGSNVSVLSKTATLTKVVFKDAKGQEYDAESVAFTPDSEDKLSKVVIEKFHTVIDGGTINIGRIDVNNFDLNSGAIVIADGKIEKIIPSKARFDLLNIQDVNFTAPDKTTGTIGQFEIKNYGLNRQSDQLIKQVNINIANIAAADKGDFLKIGKIQLDGMQFANAVQSIEHRTPPKSSPGEPKFASIDGVEAQLQGKKWALAKFEANNSKESNGDLKSRTTFNGMVINTQTNYALAPINALGYKTLDLSGSIEGNYKHDTSQWSFDPLDINVTNFGNVKASFKFNGPESLSANNPQEIVSKYALVSLKLTLQNEGLVQHLLESSAKQKGVTVEQAKATWIDYFKSDMNNSPIPLQKQGDQAIIDVLTNPKTAIMVDVQPKAPVTAISLMRKSPKEIFDALNATVKTQLPK